MLGLDSRKSAEFGDNNLVEELISGADRSGVWLHQHDSDNNEEGEG